MSIERMSPTKTARSAAHADARRARDGRSRRRASRRLRGASRGSRRSRSARPAASQDRRSASVRVRDDAEPQARARAGARASPRASANGTRHRLLSRCWACSRGDQLVARVAASSARAREQVVEVAGHARRVGAGHAAEHARARVDRAARVALGTRQRRPRRARRRVPRPRPRSRVVEVHEHATQIEENGRGGAGPQDVGRVAQRRRVWQPAARAGVGVGCAWLRRCGGCCRASRAMDTRSSAADREVDVLRRRRRRRGDRERAAPDAVVHLAARASVADVLRAPRGRRARQLPGHAPRAARRRAPRAARARAAGLVGRDLRRLGDTAIPLGRGRAARARARRTRAPRPPPICSARRSPNAASTWCARAPSTTPGRARASTYVAAELRAPDRRDGARPPRAGAARRQSRRRARLPRRRRRDRRLPAACSIPRVPRGAYNVASGVGRSIAELLERLIERAGPRRAIEVDPARFGPIAAVGRRRDTPARAPRAGRRTIPLEDDARALLDDWLARVSASP